MIEKYIVLEDIDPVVLYGAGNVYLQMVRSLFPKLRIVARGNVIKVLGDDEETERFEKSIEKMRQHILKYNSIHEEDIIDIVKDRPTKADGVKGVVVYSISGRPIKGRIIATRPGHTINNKFARQMRREIRAHEVQAPHYDCNEAPLMDVNRIRELLPHRYPMQLVDKIIEIGKTHIVGVKNVTSNEPFFQGHFPQEPVMPGVLQIEAMAQAGGLLVLSGLDEPEKWSTYFMRIDNVKFRQKVVPGDTLIFKVELLVPVRHGISSMRGYIFVGEKVVSECTFTAQIIKNK